MFKRFASSNFALSIAGFLLASHYRLIGWTNRIVRIPGTTFFEPWEQEPVIVALWHGEHFLMPFFGRQKDKLNILLSLHRDGEIVARAGRRFGLKFIRGSGDPGREFHRKRAVQAFTTMMRLLKRGESIVTTADVPKVARVAGLGIVTLAKHSGCPIVPVAMVTSRRHRLSNWDRTAINLPFGRMVMVRGEPIRVPRHADDAMLEAARRLVEERLNGVTAQAYLVADRTEIADQAQQ
ncbi:MAG: lysophospholipid acyltransferase family protein [Steroidobacteraceae bacterium]